ncbi:MAG: arginine repressor [Gemmatimonadota bacterium]|nr:arginine repressor [Gemmatimonadota bacterium]
MDAEVRARRAAIEEIVRGDEIRTQEDLRRRLAARGFAVSQSTLSRDIRELGLVKGRGPAGGTRYALPADPGQRESRALGRLLPELVVRVETAGQLLVVRTRIGAAQPVAAALDAAEWSEVAGTVAGDDTVLVVVRTRAAASRVAARLRDLTGGA